MIEHLHHVRVRYGETDQMGYLYYGHYASYYEVGRVELLRSLGMTYRELEDTHRIAMPVINLHVRYLRPARYDVEIAILTQIRQLPNREIVFHYELRDPEGKLLNGARTALGFIQVDGGSRVACPPILHQLLAPHFD